MAKTSAYYKLGAGQTRHDLKEIKRELGRIPGVLSVSLNRADGRLAVDYDDTGAGAGQIADRLRELGIDAASDGLDTHRM